MTFPVNILGKFPFVGFISMITSIIYLIKIPISLCHQINLKISISKIQDVLLPAEAASLWPHSTAVFREGVDTLGRKVKPDFCYLLLIAAIEEVMPIRKGIFVTKWGKFSKSVFVVVVVIFENSK